MRLRLCPAPLLSPQPSVNSAGNRAKLTTWEWTLLTTLRRSLLLSWNKGVLGKGVMSLKGSFTVLEWRFWNVSVDPMAPVPSWTIFLELCRIVTAPRQQFSSFLKLLYTVKLVFISTQQNAEKPFFIFLMVMFYKSSWIPLFTHRRWRFNIRFWYGGFQFFFSTSLRGH